MSSRKKSNRSKKKEQKTQPVTVQPQPIVQPQNYEFIDRDFSIYLLCPLCASLMVNPLRLHPCAHTFCQKCVPTDKKCPECSSKVKAVQKDLIGEKMVGELNVKCLNKDCPFRGSFEDFKKFHNKKCQLKEGMDVWLKDIQGIIQHHKPIAHRQNDLQEVASETEKIVQKQEEPSKVPRYDREDKEMDWSDQNHTRIKKGLC